MAGMVDAFEEAGLRVFGPTREAAELEGSKAFAKDIMRLANVPTADYAVFDDAAAAAAHVEERSERPLVVKADGLAAGKGVTVCHNRQEALAAIRHIDGRASVRRCGQTDRDRGVPHRPGGEHPGDRRRQHDRAARAGPGPQAGLSTTTRGRTRAAWGAYSPTPLVTPELLDEIIEKVLVPTVHTMKREGDRFAASSTPGLMITTQGPKVLEFNVRFGDPEAQPVLMRLKTRSGRSPAGGGGRPSQDDWLRWNGTRARPSAW